MSPLDATLDLDADHDCETPLQFRMVENMLGLVEILGLAWWEFMVDEDLLPITSDDELAMFVEARGDVRWHKAILEEMTSIEENKTWALADLPLGRRSIGLN